MFKSSGSPIFGNTTGIQLEADTFDKSRLVMTLLTNLGVTYRNIMQLQISSRKTNR